MTTSVDLSHFSLAQLHRPTPKTLHSDRLQNITSITSHVMTNFVFKFITFRYCINKGWSSNRLNDNVQLANTEIRCYESNYGKSGAKFPRCCYISTRGSSGTNLS